MEAWTAALITREVRVAGIRLEGFRITGDPQEYARRYYEQGADELVIWISLQAFMDATVCTI